MPIFSRIWTHPTSNGPDPNQLHQKGPVLQVEVSLDQKLAAHFAQQGTPIPQSVTGLGLIDTGASITGVELSILVGLGLKPISSVQILTPQGSCTQSLYACCIAFPGTPMPAINFNAVTGCQLQGQGYVALIGRDLLRHFQIVYNGVDGMWTLAF